MRAAAIQMAATPGAVEENCASAERLVLEAIRQGAEIIVLPEFFTTSMAFHPSMLDAVRPIDGEPSQLLVRLAKENNVIAGGSFIAEKFGGVFNTFVLAFPDGSTFFHDKDLPTMWENCYYEPGSDDGVCSTPVGSIGVAMCWELIRTQTIQRLKGKVDLAIGGSCWWDAPYGDDIPERTPDMNANDTLYRKTPPAFAQLLGVPFVHAAHAGLFECLTPGAKDRPYRSRWLGRAQIVDGHGNVLVSTDEDEGEAVVIADITPGQVEAREIENPDAFWLHDMDPGALSAWDSQNAFGKKYYEDFTRPHVTKLRSS